MSLVAQNIQVSTMCNKKNIKLYNYCREQDINLKFRKCYNYINAVLKQQSFLVNKLCYKSNKKTTKNKCISHILLLQYSQILHKKYGKKKMSFNFFYIFTKSVSKFPVLNIQRYIFLIISLLIHTSTEDTCNNMFLNNVR